MTSPSCPTNLDVHSDQPHTCATSAVDRQPGSAPELDSAIAVAVANGCTFVDPDDLALLGEYKWRAKSNPNGNVYVSRNMKKEGRQFEVMLHREILKAPAGMQVDHIDGDGLNNRRSNLRLATPAQNRCNQRRVFGSSRYLGVSRKGTKWTVQIESGGRAWYLGTFADEMEAARAYDEAAREIHGEFAAPNFKGGEHE